MRRAIRLMQTPWQSRPGRVATRNPSIRKFDAPHRMSAPGWYAGVLAQVDDRLRPSDRRAGHEWPNSRLHSDHHQARWSIPRYVCVGAILAFCNFTQFHHHCQQRKMNYCGLFRSCLMMCPLFPHRMHRLEGEAATDIGLMLSSTRPSA